MLGCWRAVTFIVRTWKHVLLGFKIHSYRGNEEENKELGYSFPTQKITTLKGEGEGERGSQGKEEEKGGKKDVNI